MCAELWKKSVHARELPLTQVASAPYDAKRCSRCLGVPISYMRVTLSVTLPVRRRSSPSYASSQNSLNEIDKLDNESLIEALK